jgi:hypothetical protein
MAVAKTDLKFYYTNIEPFLSQDNPAQSIGGYPSETEYSQSSHLASSISPTGLSFSTVDSLSGASFIIGNELVKAQGTSNSHSVSERGAYGSVATPHPTGEPVYALPATSLFNNAFSTDLKQYRCLAVKNEHATSTFFDLSFYVRRPSLTADTQIRIAVEIPRTDYVASAATGGSIISIVDSTLSFADNHFVGCVVKVLSGLNINQRRTVLSYDSATKTIVLDSALPFATTVGDEYEIQASPAQHVASGTVEPQYNTSRVSPFTAAESVGSAVSINFSGTRTNGVNLMPNEVVYLWIERSRAENAEAYSGNRFVFAARYRTS